MTLQVNLSAEEREELDSALRVLAERLKAPVSLGGLVKSWEQFVGEIERGYRLTIYDYTNDLTVRDDLEHLVSGVSAGLRRRLMEAVKSVDDRFEAATEEADKFLLPRPHRWWRRIPRKRSADFF
jgi:hypothetical protein